MATKDDVNKELAKAIGIITEPEFEFTENELKSVFAEIEKHPIERRSPALWQQVIKKQLGIKEFLVTEGLDASDIEYWYQKMRDILKGK
jgi:hypothetical protein